MNLLGKVSATEGTLSFDHEPPMTALCVEVVLRIALKGDNFVVWSERDQAD